MPVDVERLRIQRQGGEQHVVHFSHGPPQRVMEELRQLKILEIKSGHRSCPQKPSLAVSARLRKASGRFHVSLRLLVHHPLTRFSCGGAWAGMSAIVDRFLGWAQRAPVAGRAGAARALARAYLGSELTPAERADIETAITVLLDDPAVEVRFV